MADALDDALAEIKAGKARPFYLVHGEEFLASRAAEQLCDAMVPPKARDLNFSQLDGAAGGREVAMHLDTVPMFRGTKVVFVDGADVLLADRDVDKELARAKELWGQPARRKDAARRVIGLVAHAGWKWADLDPDAPGAPSKARWKKEAGFEPADADRAFFAEVAKYGAEHEVKAPKSDLELLLKAVSGGPPRGNHLVLLCESFDPKHPVAKVVAERGLVLKRSPETAGPSRKLHEALDIGELCGEVLGPLGKKIAPAAVNLLKDRVGGAMRLVAGELEKLALYAGDRALIEAKDVELLVAPVREEEFYELGDALASADAARTLKLLADELARGKHPLPLFGTMAAAIRRLAVDAARYANVPGALSGRELQKAEWTSSLYPRLCEQVAPGEKAPSPYPAWLNYQRIRKIGPRRVLRALALCAEIDQRIKRGADGALELERLVLAVCRPA